MQRVGALRIGEHNNATAIPKSTFRRSDRRAQVARLVGGDHRFELRVNGRAIAGCSTDRRHRVRRTKHERFVGDAELRHVEGQRSVVACVARLAEGNTP